MVRLGQQKVFGDIESISAGFSFVAPKGIWRLDKKLSGGGPLMDLGIYCLQAVCYTTGLEPLAITAQSPPVSDPTKFLDVEETLDWQMEMPNGLIAKCRTSYSESANYFDVKAKQGSFGLKPSYSYSNLRGYTPNGELSFPAASQQAAQIDAFALAIKNNGKSIVPGEMGRRDVRIIEAIYEAMRTGKRVKV